MPGCNRQAWDMGLADCSSVGPCHCSASAAYEEYALGFSMLAAQT